MGNVACKGIAERREVRQARRLIYMAKIQDSPVLGLQMFGLTSEELESLLPSIKEIQSLETLDLMGNNLESLPESIGELSRLTMLRVSHNQLETLPDSISNLTQLKVLDVSLNQIHTITEHIGNLTNLGRLDISENMLQALPSTIGNLSSLSFFNAAHNRLETLPEEMGRLLGMRYLYFNQNRLQYLPESLSNLTNNLLHFELSNNPLSQDTQTWLSNTFTNLRILSHSGRASAKQDYRDVLSKLYGTKAPDLLTRIKALNHGSFKLGDDEPKRPAIRASGKIVVQEFLERLPVRNKFDMEIYVPAAKELLEGVFKDTSKHINENESLHLMAMSLGNCPTPVKSLLTQKAIGIELKKEGAVSELFYALLEREAVEEKTQKTLGKLLKDAEKIEQVQGLCNSLFLEEGESRLQNKIKITGKRHRLPSKTRYLNYSFNSVSIDLAEAFAKMYCKTNEQNELIKDSSGRMMLDLNKF